MPIPIPVVFNQEPDMRTREDLESYFIRMNLEAEEVDEAMWLLHTEQDGGAPIVCNYSPPVVLLRLKVMELPAPAEDARLAQLYRRLLELNAGDILHGSYGIDAQEVILSDALELEDLDFSEFRSSCESMVYAASSHFAQLAALIPVAHEG
jgi:hypothetical protein